MARLTLFFQNRMVRRFPLERTVTVIGRAPDCDICIDSLGVAEQHAHVLRRADRFELIPASEQTPVVLNHAPVSQATALRHGDLIQVSRYTLSFAESEPEIAFAPPSGQNRSVPATPSPRRGDAPLHNPQFGCIQVTGGKHLGKTIALDRPLTRLGQSGNECAVIAKRSDGYYLTHLEGEHPPLLDGQSIGNRTVRLEDGATLQMGEVQMTFYNSLRDPHSATEG